MALSDLRATITYPQKMKLRELIESSASYAAAWFAPLKSDLDLLDDLSSQTASAYIAALLADTTDQAQAEPPPTAASAPAKSQGLSNNPGTITPRQRGYLKQLLKQVKEHPADWFKDLQEEPELVDSLSAVDASHYIGELRQVVEKAPDSKGAEDGAEANRPSGDQIELVITMLQERRLVQDGLIDIDVLLNAFDRRAVSTFIRALKRVPIHQDALGSAAAPA